MVVEPDFPTAQIEPPMVSIACCTGQFNAVLPLRKISFEKILIERMSGFAQWRRWFITLYGNQTKIDEVRYCGPNRIALYT